MGTFNFKFTELMTSEQRDLAIKISDEVSRKLNEIKEFKNENCTISYKSPSKGTGELFYESLSEPVWSKAIPVIFEGIKKYIYF